MLRPPTLRDLVLGPKLSKTPWFSACTCAEPFCHHLACTVSCDQCGGGAQRGWGQPGGDLWTSPFSLSSDGASVLPGEPGSRNSIWNPVCLGRPCHLPSGKDGEFLQISRASSVLTGGSLSYPCGALMTCVWGGHGVSCRSHGASG